MKTFILAGLSLPFQSHLDLSQDYEEEMDRRITRHADATARQTLNWRGKIKTRLTGSGWYPPGFDALNYDVALEMHCIAAKSVISAGTVIAIPAARRSDAGFEPFAKAVVAGATVDADMTLAGDTATVDDVTDAQFYAVYYYPRINVFTALPELRFDAMAEKYTWTLEAREA